MFKKLSSCFTKCVVMVLVIIFIFPSQMAFSAYVPYETEVLAFDEPVYSESLVEEFVDYAYSVLTSTLRNPVGMYGFEGDYALSDDPNEIVEIIVQFVTRHRWPCALCKKEGFPLDVLCQELLLKAKPYRRMMRLINSWVVFRCLLEAAE